MSRWFYAQYSNNVVLDRIRFNTILWHTYHWQRFVWSGDQYNWALIPLNIYHSLQAFIGNVQFSPGWRYQTSEIINRSLHGITDRRSYCVVSTNLFSSNPVSKDSVVIDRVSVLLLSLSLCCIFSYIGATVLMSSSSIPLSLVCYCLSLVLFHCIQCFYHEIILFFWQVGKCVSTTCTFYIWRLYINIYIYIIFTSYATRTVGVMMIILYVVRSVSFI
jgi:hypothetical protein